MRKLATVQNVNKTTAILGKDLIHQIGFEDILFECVSQKTNAQIGDRVVYFEVDSKFDERLLWVQTLMKFMEKYNWRVRTIKLGGVVSRGLALNLNEFKVIPELYEQLNAKSSGDDVTELLGITQYEIGSTTKTYPGTNLGKTRMINNFPTHVCPKTDETRLYSEKKLLNELDGLECYITTKYDGSSMTFYYDPKDQKFCLASRNFLIDPTEETSSFVMAAKNMDLEAKVRKIYEDTGIWYAFQGELCGPAVQHNKLGFKELGCYVFSVWNVEKRVLLGLKEMTELCNKYNIAMVEICNPSFVFTKMPLAEFDNLSKGKYPSGKNKEGIVIRPVAPIYSRTLQAYLSTKIINPDFQLNDEE